MKTLDTGTVIVCDLPHQTRPFVPFIEILMSDREAWASQFSPQFVFETERSVGEWSKKMLALRAKNRKKRQGVLL